MTSVDSEDSKVENVINYTQISIRGMGLVVYNSGTDKHGGVRIALSFKEGSKGSLTFSASELSEHPDIVIPRFSSDIGLFDRFCYTLIDEQVSFLSAFLRMSSSERQIRMVSIGFIQNEDLKKLYAFLMAHGIELRQADTPSTLKAGERDRTKLCY